MPYWPPLLPHVSLPREARLLIGVRAARSVSQGALVVDFALYLHALRWSAPQIGSLFMGALLASVVVTLFVGPLSDNYGRKQFLLGYEWAQVGAAMLALASSNPFFLIIAAILGSFGHGLNGSAGPLAPVELAWLSSVVPPKDRAATYSLNTAIGFFGMGIGAFVASVPSLLEPFLPDTLAYRPLFILVLGGAIVGLWLLYQIPEQKAPPRMESCPDEAVALTRSENRDLLKLFGINAINGVGIGLMGPLMAYWFAIRFHHGPLSIGPVMGLALFITAGTSLLMGRLTRRYRVVDSVIVMRYLGLMMLILLPLAPTFSWAAVLYIIRSALNRSTAGARQSLNISLVRAHRRGFAASMSNISVQIPRAIGPLIAGLLYHNGFLSLPFFIAGGFQGVYLILYRRMFHQRTTDN